MPFKCDNLPAYLQDESVYCNKHSYVIIRASGNSSMPSKKTFQFNLYMQRSTTFWVDQVSSVCGWGLLCNELRWSCDSITQCVAH